TEGRRGGVRFGQRSGPVFRWLGFGHGANLDFATAAYNERVSESVPVAEPLPASATDAPAVAPGHDHPALATLDFVLRVAFFLAVPFRLVSFAAVFSVTGALVNLGVMLLVFSARTLVRGKAERYPILRRILRRGLRFEAYYREYAPRPFLYYVVYPLLFPY